MTVNVSLNIIRGRRHSLGGRPGAPFGPGRPRAKPAEIRFVTRRLGLNVDLTIFFNTNVRTSNL